VPLLDGTTSGGGERDKHMETSLAGEKLGVPEGGGRARGIGN
jgi:hypothetical protein